MLIHEKKHLIDISVV